MTKHLQTLSLISCLIKNYKMGILQAKKIISFDYLKSVLKEEEFINQIPFRVKKIYLRAIFQIFVTGEENQKLFSDADFANLLESIVLKELSDYTTFIAGIVDKIYKRKKEKLDFKRLDEYHS